MAISYKKLWKLLIDKDMTAVDLRLATGAAIIIAIVIAFATWNRKHKPAVF